MEEKNKKQSKTRFYYAVSSTAATFAYLMLAANPDDTSAFQFLMIVAGGFGVSKATEHLKIK